MSEQPTGAFNVPEIAAMNAVSTGSEVDLVNLMVSYYQSKRPSWTPNPANIEVLLFETFAMALTGEIAAVNNVPYQIVQLLMSYEGVDPDNGARAAARIEFEITPSLLPVVIPKGTRLRLTLDHTVGESVDLLTEEPVTIYGDNGNVIGYASAAAESVGGGANGTPTGTHLDIIDNLPLVNSARLYTPVLGGRDPETEMDFAGRAEQARAAFANTLVRPENYTNFAVRDPAVGRSHVLDRYDPNLPGAISTGHVTVVTMDATGQPLTADQLTALANAIRERNLNSLAVHVISPTYTSVDMNVTVRVRTGYTPDLVSAAVQDALENWLNPLTWDWSDEITAYMIVGLLSTVPGVAEIVSVPASIPLATPAPVPVPGAITVTTQI